MKLNLKYCGLVVLLGMIWVPCEAKNMAVVVDKANITANVAATDLIKIFQSTTRKWPDGKTITVVMRDPSLPEMQQALQHLYKMSADEFKSFVATHKGSFITADSDENLLKLVETTPGAVGLVDVYSITSHINVVKVDGKLPLEQGYALR
jgi:ABC-type phosphate transport system substrate-binding protein